MTDLSRARHLVSSLSLCLCVSSRKAGTKLREREGSFVAFAASLPSFLPSCLHLRSGDPGCAFAFVLASSLAAAAAAHARLRLGNRRQVVLSPAPPHKLATCCPLVRTSERASDKRSALRSFREALQRLASRVEDDGAAAAAACLPVACSTPVPLNRCLSLRTRNPSSRCRPPAQAHRPVRSSS